jgi:hypothetical protein
MCPVVGGLSVLMALHYAHTNSCSPQVLELARQLEGCDDIYFRNGGINEIAPGRGIRWHRDSYSGDDSHGWWVIQTPLRIFCVDNNH